MTAFGTNGYTGPGGLNYQLACYHTLAGDRHDALRHLRGAFANDPRTRQWAAGDEDLITVRDDPSDGLSTGSSTGLLSVRGTFRSQRLFPAGQLAETCRKGIRGRG